MAYLNPNIDTIMSYFSLKLNDKQVEEECVKISNNKEFYRKNASYLHLIITRSPNPKISAEIYKILSEFYFTKQKHKEAFDYFLQYAVIDCGFVSVMIEYSEIIPDFSSVSALLKKYHLINKFLFSQLIDLMVLYGLTITKDMLINVIQNSHYINEIEKYNILIDEDIYLECIKLNYYPYKLGIVPTDKIIHSEIQKSSNSETDKIKKIKDLKELGGIFTTCCLEVACLTPYSNRTIKYLIQDLMIEPTNTCVKNYFLSKSQDIEILDLLLKPQVKQDIKPKEKPIILDIKSTLKIELCQPINKNSSYKLKSKIKHFFNCKEKIINYEQLYKTVIEYLITKNLVIGTYFIINSDLSKLLKLNESSLLHIDELDNVISYFIEKIDK